jgi:EAL domain-containing protein (putative c-di-GMP-specific phosphodiesterase class I)
LEIEEIAIYDKSSVIYNNILRLKNLGFKIAIDGFGIDFNALEHIEKLNINAIKFKYNTLVEKKSFAAQKLFETLLEFVKNRKMLLFVQDIESELMIENIKDLNIQYGQGYYFSKVLSEAEMVELLQNEND